MIFRPFVTLVSLAALGAAVAAPSQSAHGVNLAATSVLTRQAPKSAAQIAAAKKAAAQKAAKKLALKKAGVVKKPVAKAPAKKVGLLPAPAEKKAIQAKYDAMSLLVMRRQGNKLAQLLMGMTTPDFVYRDKKGRKQNRMKLIGDLKAQMKMVAKFKRSGNKVASFAMKGPVGTAQVVSDFAMVFPNGKKFVTVVGQSTTVDTWVKGASGWKLKSIRTLKENVKYNGKPM